MELETIYRILCTLKTNNNSNWKNKTKTATTFEDCMRVLSQLKLLSSVATHEKGHIGIICNTWALKADPFYPNKLIKSERNFNLIEKTFT